MMQNKWPLLAIIFLIASYASASPNSLLHRGMKKCSMTRIEKALQKGADPNAMSTTDEWGFAPLHVAVMSNCYSAVFYLLNKSNAAVDILDDLDRTPLHLAALAKNKKIFWLLIRFGADFDFADTNNMTPADIAEKNAIWH